MTAPRATEALGPRLVPDPLPAGRDEQELALAHLLLRGERTAAPALWDYFLPLVRGLLARALGPDAEVEDALQDIFFRIFHKGRTLRDPAQLRSFVVAVTLHHIRSEFRRRRVRRIMRLTGDSETFEERSSQPGAVLAVRSLYRALDRLPSDERLAFTLRFFEGMELSEAAEATGTSLATFKRRVQAAKQRLWALTGEDPFLAPYLGGDDAATRKGAQR